MWAHYPFVSWWTFGLFRLFSHYNNATGKHSCTSFFIDVCFQFMEHFFMTFLDLLVSFENIFSGNKLLCQRQHDCTPQTCVPKMLFLQCELWHLSYLSWDGLISRDEHQSLHASGKPTPPSSIEVLMSSVQMASSSLRPEVIFSFLWTSTELHLGPSLGVVHSLLLLPMPNSGACFGVDYFCYSLLGRVDLLHRC